MTPETAASWEHFHHVADIGVRGSGSTLAEAFEQVALAMTAVIIDPTKVAETEAIEIAVSATDREMLLVEWLDALIYEMATRKMLFRRFRVELHDHALRAEAWGGTDRCFPSPARRRDQGRHPYRTSGMAGQRGHLVCPMRGRCLKP